ncbi:MAG TPA: hypothetical protein VMZ11_08240 [Mycobacteriales bacterium]|nr:hypothetical protein [Mycobacteriales bacterium]
MRVLNHASKRLLTIAGVSALVAVPWPASAAASSGDKQTICHATSSDTNAYVVETPNKDGDVSGHAGHTGPVWGPTLKGQHISWGDIIPPFDYPADGGVGHFPGLNWDADGQAWFANDCQVPITGTVDKTNDADGDASFTDDETAPSEGADVAFHVVVTNTSIVGAVVTGVTDSVSGSPLSFTADPDPVGTALAPGASVSFSFTLAGYSPADGASVVNVVSVGLAEDGNADNDSTVTDDSTVRTAVPPPPAPDVSVLKTGTASATPGDDLTWTLTATNDGEVAAAGVTLTDSLPDGTTLVSVGGTGWTCAGTTDLTCTLDTELAIGSSAAVTVVATLDADFSGTSVSNTAVVTPEDATPDDNTSTAVTDVTSGGGGGGTTTGGTTTGGTTGGLTGGGGGVATGGGGTALPFTGLPLAQAVAAALAAVLLGLLALVLVPRRTSS